MVEIIVVLALFGAFLVIIMVLTMEMKRVEKKYPVNFMTHPSISAVISRLRKDVLDCHGECYMRPKVVDGYEQTSETLVVETLLETGYVQRVVWDFRKEGEVRRRIYGAGNMFSSEWVARGVPKFTILSFQTPGDLAAVRINATDERGQLAIDQIFQPRARE